jgi:hypothetical protein
MITHINNKKSGLFIMSILFLLENNIIAQSNSYSKEINRRINSVENGLMNWVQTPDTSLRWSIKN